MHHCFNYRPYDQPVKFLLWRRFKKWLARKLIVSAYKVQDLAYRIRNWANKIDPPEEIEKPKNIKTSLFVTGKPGVPLYGWPN